MTLLSYIQDPTLVAYALIVVLVTIIFVLRCTKAKGKYAFAQTDSKTRSVPTQLTQLEMPLNRHSFSFDQSTVNQIESLSTSLNSSSLNSSSYKSQVVGIAGCSGSGKSYVAEKIVADIQENQRMKNPSVETPPQLAAILRADSYYKGVTPSTNSNEKEAPTNSNKKKALKNFDEPNAIDFDLLREHLELLKQGHTIKSPVYNFKTHSREQNQFIEIHPAPLIIIEGILIFTDEKIRDLCDLRVFIDTKDSTRIFRRLKRDIHERGRSLEEVEDRYETHVSDSQEQYVLPSARYADIRLLNEKGRYVGLNVLLVYIRDLLRESGQFLAS